MISFARLQVFFTAPFVVLALGAAAATPTLTTTALWQDNATNASRSSDVIGAFTLDAEIAVAHRLELSHDDAVIFAGRLSGETWPRFDGLDSATIGGQLGWQRKFGLGAQAPVLSLTLSADAVIAHESDRAGLAGGATLAWRQRFGDATVVTVSEDLSRLDARGAVFDRSAAETTLVVAQNLNATWQFSTVARLRYGDVLSYGTPPRPDLVALARVRTPNTTFDRPFVAYSFEARTVGGGFSLTRVLDDRTSLALAAEYRETEKAALRYINHLVSATLVHQF